MTHVRQSNTATTNQPTGGPIVHRDGDQWVITVPAWTEPTADDCRELLECLVDAHLKNASTRKADELTEPQKRLYQHAWRLLGYPGEVPLGACLRDGTDDEWLDSRR